MDWYSKQAEIAQFLITSDFVQAAYVGVELRQKENEYKPVYKEGEGFEWVGTNDTESPYAYIRIIEKIELKTLDKLTPNMRLYDASAKMRIVFWCRASWESVFNSLMDFPAFQELEILSIEHDLRELWKKEQSGVPFKIIPNDISYFAIDFSYSELVSNTDCARKFLECTQKDKYKFTKGMQANDLGCISICSEDEIILFESSGDYTYEFRLIFSENVFVSIEKEALAGENVVFLAQDFDLNELYTYELEIWLNGQLLYKYKFQTLR